MKKFWTGRLAAAAGKYGEHAPMAAACCNACRTCATTNLIGLATAGVAVASLGLARFVKNIARPT
jgi:hypothetical protein